MKTTALLATLAMMIAPNIAAAMGCTYGHEDTASISCADGTTYDAETQRCIAVTG